MHAWLIISVGMLACCLFGLFVVLVEKILRVQPDVKKLFLLIRAADVESAKQRLENKVSTKYFSILPSILVSEVVSNGPL
jgi:thioester reductase-like protein